MILKSYLIKKDKSNFKKKNLFLLYGENVGLKKDIKDFIVTEIKKQDKLLVEIFMFMQLIKMVRKFK